MNRKREKGSQESTSRALGQIGLLLKKAQLRDKNLGEALRVISEYLAASSSALFRLKQDDKPECSQIENIGSWPLADMNSLSLESMFIADSAWSDLKKRKIIHSHPVSKIPGHQPDFFFLPLFLDDHLSCIIISIGPERNRLTGEVREFLEGAISLFELWLSKMNLAKKFDDLINFLPYAMIGLDTHGNVTVWNSAVEQMTGCKGSRILGKGNYEYALPFYGIRRPAMCDLILHPDPRWLATYTEYRQEGDVVHSSIFTPALGGTGAFVTSITGRMRDLNGRVYGSLHMVRDVTQERQMENKLQSSESMFKAITDYAGLGIALFQKGTALYCNDQFGRLLGISGREIGLSDLVEAVDTEDRKEIQSRLESLSQGTEEGPLRLDLNLKVGNRHRNYSSYSQVLGYGGHPTICFVLDDTTEQKELAKKVRLNELKMYHEGRLTSLGIMAAGIAHELNQPINTIRVVTDGFLFGRDEGWSLDVDEFYEGMEMISSQVRRISEVIRNIRNFARGDLEQEFEDVDVNRTIENVFSMIGRQFEAHGITVHKKLTNVLPSVKAHANQLEQVIMNLLVNARQALDGCNHGRKELWITTNKNTQSVYIEVIDNAIGIPDHSIDKIFDPFFTTKEVGQGTGLGLTISKSIIRELNGTIEVFNNKLGGATFLITLPTLGETK